MNEIEKTQETEKKSKNKVLLKFFRKHKIILFIFLFLALGTNTYAWFIFNKIVSSNITGHVRSWNISLDGIDDSWNVDLNDLYPGMESIHQEAVLSNDGEQAARVKVSVAQYTLFGELYSSVASETYPNPYDRTVLYNNLNSYYPFKVTIQTNAEEIRPGEKLKITVDVEWPFEGTRTDPDGTMTANEWDTYWGNKAYEFYNTNGSDSVSLHILVDINTDQIKE